MEKKTGYDAVVFDMDGVIFDSERAVMQCWKELADKYQIPDIEKAVLSCTGTTMKRTREIMLEIYGEDFRMIFMRKSPLLSITADTMAAGSR